MPPSKQYLNNKTWNIPALMEEPVLLDADDSYEIYVFRRMLEAAMYMGLWSGTVGMG